MTAHNTSPDTSGIPSWLEEQKKEDIFEEIIYNCSKTHSTDLRRVGWNGIPNRFRAPSWQILLNYLPCTKSKRAKAVIRKRDEYSKLISKFAAQFDFALTDQCQINPPFRDFDAEYDIPIEKPQTDGLFHDHASKAQSKLDQDHEPEFKTEEDRILQQIRHDIDNMVDVPLESPNDFRNHNHLVDSISKAQIKGPKRVILLENTKSLATMCLNRCAKERNSPYINSSSRYGKNQEDMMTVRDIIYSSPTTTLKLFLNPKIKACVERILYLTSVKHLDTAKPKNLVVNNSDESNTTGIGYIPGLIDMIVPLFLVMLQGHIWGTHISGTVSGRDSFSLSIQNKINKKEDNIHKKKFKNASSTSEERKIYPTKLGSATNSKFMNMNESEGNTKIMESRVLEEKERAIKKQECLDLCNGKNVDSFPDEILEEVEADTYWCLEILLMSIQKYRFTGSLAGGGLTGNVLASSSSVKTSRMSNLSYENSMIKNKNQIYPGGLQKKILLMESVVSRVDPVLQTHLKKYGVEYIWFAFQWMNSLLVREMSSSCILRLWDTLLCEEGDVGVNHSLLSGRAGRDLYAVGIGSNFSKNIARESKTKSSKNETLTGFHSFQVYICASLLHKVRTLILSKSNFNDILFRLRNLPINNWSTQDISELVGQAYIWKETFSACEKQMLVSLTPQYGNSSLLNWMDKCHWPPRKSSSRPTQSVESLTNIMYDVEGIVLNP